MRNCRITNTPHGYPLTQVNKTTLLLLLIYSAMSFTTVLAEPPQLGFIQLIGQVTVSTTQLLQQVSLTIPSTHDYEDYTNILTEIKTIQDKLIAIPALENGTVFYKSIGHILTEIKNDLVVIQSSLQAITTHKDKTVDKTLTSNCDILWRNLKPATLLTLSKGIIVATTNTKWEATVDDLTSYPAEYHTLYETLTKVHELLNDYAILVTDRVRLLDLMLNKQIGDELLSAISSKNCVKLANFESTKIIACFKHSKGISCNVEIAALTEQQIYQQFTPVNYRGLQLSAFDTESYFVKTLEDKWGILTCTLDEDQQLDLFDYCSFTLYDNDCSAAFTSQDYSDYSSHCNFTRQTPKLHIRTTTGILIQGEDLIIRLKDLTTGVLIKKIEQRPPLLVQSNYLIEIEKDGSFTQIKPTEEYTEEYIAESWLNEADIDNLELKNTVYEILDDISYGEYIDIGLLILMGIIIPIIGVLLKNRPINTWNQNSNEKHRRNISKKNLKQNREMTKMLS